MEDLINNPHSWFLFVSISLLLIVFQQILAFWSRHFKDFLILGKTKIPVTELSQKGMVILEPIIWFIIFGLFIRMNPLVHGIILLIICALIFQQILDYLSGRVILYSSTIRRDKKISVANYSGSIVKTGRLGLFILSHEGVTYLNYYRILSEGFTLTAGEELGEYCHIKVSSKSAAANPKELKRKLNEMLVTLPFVDWKYKPKITTSAETANEVEMKVLLHENVSSEEVILFLTESGYHCEIKKN